MTDSKPEKPDNWWPVIGAVFAIIAIGIVGAVVVNVANPQLGREPSSSAEPANAPQAAPVKEQPSLRVGKDGVRGIEKVGDNLVVTLSVDAGLSDVDIIEIGASDIILGAFAVQAGAPEANGARVLTYKLMTPAIDRLGRPQDGPVIDVSFSMDDVRAAKLENLGPAHFMDLAETVKIRTAIGERGVRGWCRKQIQALDDIPNFCRVALRL